MNRCIVQFRRLHAPISKCSSRFTIRGQVYGRVPAQCIFTENAKPNATELLSQTGMQRRATTSPARSVELLKGLRMDDSTDTDKFTVVLQTLRDAIHFRVAERWLIFTTAMDVLVPMLHAHSLASDRVVELLSTCAMADILPPILLDAIMTFCLREWSTMSLQQQGRVCTVQCVDPSRNAKTIADFSHKAALLLRATDVSTADLSAVIAFFCAASHAGVLLRDLSPLIAACMGRYISTNEFTALKPVDQLHKLQTILSALTAQTHTDHRFAVEAAAALCECVRELNATVNASAYIDVASRTKIVWMAVSCVYDIMLQHPPIAGTDEMSSILHHVVGIMGHAITFGQEDTSMKAVVSMLFRCNIASIAYKAPRSLPSDVSAALQRAYIDQSKTHVSHAQKDVFKRLQKLATTMAWPEPVLEHRIPEGLQVDMLLPLPQRIVVEVDGPFHFSYTLQHAHSSTAPTLTPSNDHAVHIDATNFYFPWQDAVAPPKSQTVDETFKPMANLSTLFHRHLLRMFGYRVVTVPYTTYQQQIMGKSGPAGSIALHNLLKQALQ